MIGVNASSASALMRRQTSMPSTFGIMMSSRIKSGRCRLVMARASSPSPAWSTA
jgi:hypothetical protein